MSRPALLQHIKDSYSWFEKRLPELVISGFPRLKNFDLDVRKVDLLEPHRPESVCREKGFSYHRPILIDLSIGGEPEPRRVLLGFVPELTRRHTLYFGKPSDKVVTAQLQFRYEKEQLKVFRFLRRERERQVSWERPGVSSEMPGLETLMPTLAEYNTEYNRRDSEARDLTKEDLLAFQGVDLGADLKKHYKLRFLGDLLFEGSQKALKRIQEYFSAFPPDPKEPDEFEHLFLASLPSMFTVTVERHLTRSGLLTPPNLTNPLAELASKRKVTFYGPRCVYDDQDVNPPERRVHESFRGGLCPVETEESNRMGLNLQLARGARLTVEDNPMITAKSVEEGDILGLCAGLVPFLEHDDVHRVMMGAKYLKQALPLLHAERALVETGLEEEIAKHCADSLQAEESGKLGAIDRRDITLDYGQGKVLALPRVMEPGSSGRLYRTASEFAKESLYSGVVTCISKENDKTIVQIQPQASVNADTPAPTRKIPIDDGFTMNVKVGDEVQQLDILAFQPTFKKGDQLAHGASTLDGHLTLGVNLLVAYMPWYGFNFEDAIVISRRLVDDDILTSLEVVAGENGPKMLLHPIQIGDKLAGRHGNKGVVGLIEDIENMPRVQLNGREVPVDILLNPLGIISRMNIGQLYETHWGWLIKTGAVEKTMESTMAFQPFRHVGGWEKLDQNGINDGKQKLTWRDRETKEEQTCQAVVGYQYILKLDHRAEPKLHVRLRSGPRSRVTGQPVRGKREEGEGGLKVGEMEVWALKAHQAVENLHECLTSKSDVFEEDTEEFPKSEFPETSRVFLLYLRALGISARLVWKDGKERDLNKPSELPSSQDLKQIEFSLATDEEVREWGQNREVKISDLEADWYRCQGRGQHREAKLGQGNQPSKKLCKEEKCGAPMEKIRWWHPEGLFGTALWNVAPGLILDGTDDPMARERAAGAYIELAHPVLHPLWKSHTLKALYIPPPALRPVRKSKKGLDKGLNAYYTAILKRNKTVSKLMKANEAGSNVKPLEPVLSKLQMAVAQLFDYIGTPNLRDNGPLYYDGRRSRWDPPPLAERLREKGGLVRGHLLGKRVDWSARAVIVPNPDLPYNTCYLPKEIYEALEEAQGKDSELVVLLNRPPTLHRLNLLAFLAKPWDKPWLEKPWDKPVIGIHPLVCGPFAADFDGDTMTVHIPRGEEAVKEAREKLLAEKHAFSVANGRAVLSLSQDLVAGAHLWSKENPDGFCKLGEKEEQIDVTAGVKLQALVERRLRDGKDGQWADVMNWVKDAFAYATRDGLSISLKDFQKFLLSPEKNYPPEPSDLGAILQPLAVLMKKTAQEAPKNPISLIITSGARGNFEQLARICGVCTTGQDAVNYFEGLTPAKFLEAADEARTRMLPKKFGTPRGGGQARALVFKLYPVMITELECEDKSGLRLPLDSPLMKFMGGRTPVPGKKETFFSPLTCKAGKGVVCQRCYGHDLSTNKLAEPGLPVGLLAAQSISERATQGFMKEVHGTSSTSKDFELAKEYLTGHLGDDKVPQRESGCRASKLVRILTWLMEVYQNAIHPVHFEVAMRFRHQRPHGPLAQAAEKAYCAADVLVQAAAHREIETFEIEPSRILFGISRDSHDV